MCSCGLSIVRLQLRLVDLKVKTVSLVDSENHKILPPGGVRLEFGLSRDSFSGTIHQLVKLQHSFIPNCL